MQELSREDKVELAKKRLSKFQKKRGQKSSLASSQQEMPSVDNGASIAEQEEGNPPAVSEEPQLPVPVHEDQPSTNNIETENVPLFAANVETLPYETATMPEPAPVLSPQLEVSPVLDDLMASQSPLPVHSSPSMKIEAVPSEAMLVEESLSNTDAYMGVDASSVNNAAPNQVDPVEFIRPLTPTIPSIMSSPEPTAAVENSRVVVLPERQVSFYTPPRSGAQIVPDPASPSLVEVVDSATSLDSVSPDMSYSQESIGNSQDAINDSQKSSSRKKRLSKTMLEHVDYMERLNNALTKENKSLSDLVKELKQHLEMSDNEKLAIERHNAAVEAQIASFKMKCAQLERVVSDMNDIKAQNLMYQEQLNSYEMKNLNLIDDNRSLVANIEALRTEFEQRSKDGDAKFADSLRAIEELKAQLEKSSDHSAVDATLEKYQKDIGALKTENQNLVTELGVATKKYDDQLKAIKEEHDAVLADKQMQLNDFSLEFKAAKEENEKLSEELANFKSSRDSVISGIQAEKEELMRQQQSLQNKISSLEAVHMSEDKDLHDIQGKYAAVVVDNQTLNSEVTQYRESASKLIAENASLKKMLDDAKNEVSDLQKDVSELNSKQNTMSLQIVHIKEETKHEVEIIQQSVIYERVEKERVLVEKQSMSSTISDLQKSVGEFEATVRQLKNDLHYELAEKERLLVEKKNLEKQKTSIEQKGSDLETEIARIKEHSAETIERIKKDVDGRVHDLNEQLSEFIKENQSLKDSIHRDVDRLENEKRTLESKLLDEQRQHRALSDKLNQLVAELKVAKDAEIRLGAVEVDLSVSREETSLLRARIQELSGEIGHDKLLIASEDAELLQAHEKIDRLLMEVKTLSQDKAEIKRLHEKDLHHIHELERKVESLKTDFELVVEEKDRENAEILQANDEVGRLMAEIKMMSQRNAEKEQLHERDLHHARELERKVESLKKDIEFIAMEKDDLKQSMTENELENSVRLEQLQSQHHAETREIRTVLHDEQAEKNRLLHHVAKLQDELRYVKKDFEDQIIVKENQIKELLLMSADTSALETMQTSLDDIRSNLAITIEELNSLRTENAQVTGKLEEARAEIQKFENEFKAKNEEIITKKDEYQAKIKLLDMELSQSREYETKFREVETFICHTESASSIHEISTNEPVISRLNQILIKQVKQIQEEKFMLKEITAKYLEAEEKYSKLCITHSDLEVSVKESEKEKSALQQKFLSINSTLSEERMLREKVQREASSEELTVLRRKVETAEAVVKTTRETLVQYQSMFKDAQVKIDLLTKTLQKEKESAAASIEMLEGMLADEKDESRRLRTSQSSQTRARSPDGRDGVHTQIFQLETENKELTSLLQSATDDLEASIRNLRELQASHQTLEVRLGKQNDEAIQVRNILLSQAINIDVHTVGDDLVELAKLVLSVDQPHENRQSADRSRSGSIMRQLKDLSKESRMSQDHGALHNQEVVRNVHKKLDEANAQILTLTEKIEYLTKFYDEQLQNKITTITSLHDTIDSLKIKENENRIALSESLKPLPNGMADRGIMNDLQNSILVKNEEINYVKGRLNDFQSALAHAERTIGTLTAELDNRNSIIENMKLTHMEAQFKSPAIEAQVLDEPSPVLERQVECAMQKAGETVNVIDELVRLAKKKGASQLEIDTRVSASGNAVSGAERSLLLRMKQADEKEIQALRSALDTISSKVAQIQTSFGNDDASIGLLQTHISQLKKMWDQEVQVNDSLRKLVDDLRQDIASRTSVATLDRSSSANSGARLESLLSEISSLRSEISSLHRNVSYLEQDNLRLRSEAQTSRFDDSAVRLNETLITQKYEMEELKRKFRDEKQSLLDRFKIKINEFEAANKSQQGTIVRLKEERRILEMRIRQYDDNHSASRSNEDYVALQREISALRSEQKVLNENISRERTQFEQQLRMQQQIIEKDNGLRTSLSNLEKSVMQSLYKDQNILNGSSSLNAASASNANEMALLKRERERHQVHCKKLVSKIFELKIRCKRESGYRADLIYQKNYLLVLMGGLEACEKLATSVVHRMNGTNAITSEHNQQQANTAGAGKPLKSFKRICTAVVFISRVKLIQNQWKRYTADLLDR